MYFRDCGGYGRSSVPFGLLPAACTFITISLDPGIGMGMSWVVVWSSGKGWTMISFIVWVE